jgi:hypothetical protein
MTDTTIAGEAFLARVEAAQQAGQCPHETFQEVADVEWLTAGIGMCLASLAVGVESGASLDDLARAAEHCLIVIAAAGMAAGQATAATAVASLADVDWDNLPDVYGD